MQMSAPNDTVSWCAPERSHQPPTVSFSVPRPNWKAGCRETVRRVTQKGIVNGIDRSSRQATL